MSISIRTPLDWSSSNARRLGTRGRVLYSDSRSAELLSDTHKNLIREPRVLYGASQHDATDHRGGLKDGFFPVPTHSREIFLKPPLEHPFEFRGGASHLLPQSGHGATVA